MPIRLVHERLILSGAQRAAVFGPRVLTCLAEAWVRVTRRRDLARPGSCDPGPGCALGAGPA